jgi:PST family polysaccharide transporter
LKIAWRIFDFVAQVAIVPIANVALSLFARAAPAPERLARSFTETMKVLALVSFPVFFGLSALATDLIALALGPKWADSSHLIQLLGVLSLAAAVNYLSAPALIAAGRTGQVLAVGVLQNTLTAVLALASVGFGALAVMIAHVIRAYLLAAVSLYTVQRAIGLPITRALAAMAPAAMASAAMAALVLAARPSLIAYAGVHGGLALAILTGVIAYTFVLIVGDLVGVWPDYVRGTVMDVRAALHAAQQSRLAKGAPVIRD